MNIPSYKEVYDLAKFSLVVYILINIVLLGIVFLKYYLFNIKNILKNSCFYVGRVTHTRLKGGAVHHLDYPIFFASVDLHEMVELGWFLWPLFGINLGGFAYCSLDYDYHLKGHDISTPSLLARLKSFIQKSSEMKLDLSITNGKRWRRDIVETQAAIPVDKIQLITHLTYFGYCFNPVSFYFIYKNPNVIGDNEEDMNFDIDDREVDFILVEVSNTPWIEQHSYLLHECMKNIEIHRNHERKTFQGIWNKAFHVSPFMEMDYKYDFTFTTLSKSLSVKSKLIKQQSNEIWFTANFDVKRIDFTPCNLLYLLIFYPMQTRLIQIYIHYEALLLWLKGVPTFTHPDPDAKVEFGLGITDRHILQLVNYISSYYDYFKALITLSKSKPE